METNLIFSDEFVWIDSHSRLVELQQLPWTQSEVMKVLQRTLENDKRWTLENGNYLESLLF